MSNDIVSKSFYLSGLFSDIKPDVSWTSNELKLVLLIFSELSKHRIYLPDFDYFDKNMDEFYSMVNNIPLEYKFSRKKFQEVTGVPDKHLAREIKKTIRKLLSKTMITPHPLDQNDHNSIEGITWFSRINYFDKTGLLNIEMNRYALERLIALIKYTNIDLDIISNLSNHNSIYLYLTMKILKDSNTHKDIRVITMTLDEFKERLSLTNKYRSISTLEEYVLKTIHKDINSVTDIDFTYILEKGESGKAKKYIKMIFDYKPENLEEKSKEKVKKVKQLKDSKIIESKSIDEYDSPFKQILISWNIRARKVIELEEIYSLDVIQSAINLTLEKEKAGEIKTTKAAIFLGILANKQLASDEQFEKAKNELENQQDKKLREKISAEYDKLSSFILSNQDIIQSALTANTKQLPITDKDAIPIFKKLKSINADKFRAYTVPILNFYHFESNSNVSSILSDIVDRSHYIEIEEYKDEMEIVQAYKKAFERIKENEYMTNVQKDTLRKEALETINMLLGL